MSYDWFKVDAPGWIDGSIRCDLNMEQQGIWIGLLALGSLCRVRDGALRHAPGKPMSRERIANALNITVEKLNATIEICLKDKNKDNDRHRVEIAEDGAIVISNWDHYQAIPAGKKHAPKDDRERDLRGRQQAIKSVQQYPDEAKAALDRLQEGKR